MLFPSWLPCFYTFLTTFNICFLPFNSSTSARANGLHSSRLCSDVIQKTQESLLGFFRPLVLTLPVAVLVSASFLEYKLLEGVNHVLYILVFPVRPFLSELAIQGMAPDHIPVTPCGRRSGQILAVRECPGQLSNGFQASLGCVPGTGLCKARGRTCYEGGRACDTGKGLTFRDPV